LKPDKPGYFLDASTLIHAIDRDAEYQKECLDVINRAAKGSINAATSLETLEETLFVLSRLTSVEVAIRAVRDYLKLQRIEKHEMRRATFENAIEIMEVAPLKRPKDAINVATMLEHNITTIISEDTDYDALDIVERVHPKDV
jgi:predicted nucleic acid-binding protein